MIRKTKHLIILSLDALGSTDFQLLASLPNTQKILEKASFCKNVQSIYPSITYPAHTSIITGCYPKKHGIINNTLLQPGRKSPDWFWYQKDVKVPSLIDVALENKLTVASLLWPVTAKSKIQYNVPEIFANRSWENQIIASLRSGSPYLQFKLNQLFGYLRKGKAQPYLDNFTHESAKYIIKKYKPNITLVHLTDLDAQKHHYGCESSEAKEAIKRLDDRIGEIVKLIKEEGMNENTTLILLGDHSQHDAQKIIYLNALFHQEKLLTIKNKRISAWQVLSKTCDGSTYIYMKDKNNFTLKQKVKEILQNFANNKENGIAQIFSSEEAAVLGADPNCTFMIEAQKGYYFLDEADKGLVQEIEKQAIHQYSHSLIATHGYLPTLKDYQTIFIATGAGIKENVEMKEMGLIDEGPTFAQLLGLKLPNPDGNVLSDIIL